MKNISLHGSSILFSENNSFFKPAETAEAMVIDEKVLMLHSHHLPNIPAFPITASEQNKTPETVTAIHRFLLKQNIDRHSAILGIGGGIVCDITGFAASTFFRGISFGLIPTTLLAQTDAAIGGKNGVNLDGFKNIVGTVTQPKWVGITPLFLSTLPDREIRNGLIEMIKHAIIASPALFALIEKHIDKLLSLHTEILSKALSLSIDIKVAVVTKDEREQGQRKVLNLGHTVGHAIEATHSTISHGEAVAAGILYAIRLSRERNYISSTDYQRIKRLIQTVFPGNRHNNAVWPSALKADKKKNGNTIDFIMPRAIGSVDIVSLTPDEIISVI